MRHPLSAHQPAHSRPQPQPSERDRLDLPSYPWPGNCGQASAARCSTNFLAPERVLFPEGLRFQYSSLVSKWTLKSTAFTKREKTSRIPGNAISHSPATALPKTELRMVRLQALFGTRRNNSLVVFSFRKTKEGRIVVEDLSFAKQEAAMD